MDKYIGKVFENRIGLQYIVESVAYETYKGKHYNIRFLKSGYHTVTTSSEINAKKIKDKLCPQIFGVGCLGYVKNANSKYKREYSVWHDMLNRCYNDKYPEARYYSQAGVKVCKRWHRFDHFLDDIGCIPGWNKEMFLRGEIYLDKDRRSDGDRIYSPQTCSWITATENHPLNVNTEAKV